MKLHLLLWLAALAGVALLVGQPTRSAAAPAETHRVYLPLVRGINPPARPRSLFGVATTSDLFNQTERITGLQADWVRTSIRWRDVEPTDRAPNDFLWEYSDSVVRKAIETGAQPLMLFWENPSWAASTTCGPVDRASEADIAEVVRAMVERYDRDGFNDAPGSPLVPVYEFYNEPDWNNKAQTWLGGCWGQHGDDYARFMRIVWTAAHQAWDDVVIINGSIASENLGNDPETGQPYFNFNRNGGDFLDDFLEAGGGRYIDGLNIHFFHAFHNQWDEYGTDIIGKTRYFRDQRLRPRDLEGKPFYASEVGRRSDSGQVIDGVGGTPQLQSEYVPKVFVRALTVNYKAITWFTASDEPDKAWGLIDRSGNPKPSYAAFRTMVRELPGATSGGNHSFPSSIEGYKVRIAGGATKFVVWSRSNNSAQMPLEASEVRLVRHEGEVRTIVDGSSNDRDGARNGTVVVNVTAAPVYLSVVQP